MKTIFEYPCDQKGESKKGSKSGAAGKSEGTGDGDWNKMESRVERRE